VRSAVIGSAVVHLALTAALFVVRTSRTILVPGPDVVQVSLVDASLAQQPAPVPPAPAPPERPAPAEERGVRIEKPKPKPRERAERPPEPAPARKEMPEPQSTAARVVLPYADVGGGMRGQVAVDDKNFEFAYYLQQVRVMIARNWAPPAGVPAGTRAEVYFRVGRDGSLTAPRLETSSGNDYFDQTAQRAVIVTGHLPPLPLGYSGADLGIHFGFEYSGP
jgi:TonB family protein